MDSKEFAELLEKRLVKLSHRYYRAITPIECLPIAIDEPFQKDDPPGIVEITALNEYRFEYDQRKDILSAMHFRVLPTQRISIPNGNCLTMN